MAIRVGEVRLPLAGRSWRGIVLLKHQDEAFRLAEEPRLIVEAPTGGGKTWTAAAPLVDALDRGEGAIFVYPTNALADDQQDSLLDLVRRAGRPVAQVCAKGDLKGDENADVLVWRVHAPALDVSRDEVGGRYRGDVLERMFERLPTRPLWWVVNPDALYLLLLARYRRSPQFWNRLQACPTLVLDEFHLYRGPSLVRALILIELAALLLGTRRFRILSATLADDVRNLLKDRFGFQAIRAEPTPSGHPILHPVDLEVVIGGQGATDGMASRICGLLESLRAEAGRGRGVPLVVLRQSVLATMRLEDELVGRGLSHGEIGVYRGLTNKAIRSMEGKTLVLGTSALEVGVDFRTSRLLFEARSAPAFVQRLGRVGRHEAGWAVFYTDHRVVNVFSRLGDTMNRAELLDLSRRILEPEEGLGGFALSSFGWAVARAALDGLRTRAFEMGAPEMFNRKVDQIERTLRERLWPILHSEQISRAVQTRLATVPWFRGGPGSVKVFDDQECHRRGSKELAEYEVELPVFFRCAVVRGSPKPGRSPVVAGYEKPRKLSLSLRARTAVIAGLHAPSPEELELRVDGQTTPWEHLLRETPHVVGLFPGCLRGHLSWREDVFESSDDRIALLDDDALVGAYVWSKDAVEPDFTSERRPLGR